jgi:hypothetical protein
MKCKLHGCDLNNEENDERDYEIAEAYGNDVCWKCWWFYGTNITAEPITKVPRNILYNTLTKL